MITLREAVAQGRLEQFIAEHPEVKGDMDAFNRTVEAMAQTSGATRQTSSRGGSGD